MQDVRTLGGLLLLLSCAAAQNPQLVKSVAGPSGQVVDGKFVITEVRNRFNYPADKSLVVYFEWTGSIGPHTLSGFWKDSTGRVASISDNIQVEARKPEFAAFWTFDIAPTMASGIWTLDVRVDGQPAGSHSFELTIPAATAPSTSAPVEVDRMKAPPSLDEIYKTASSLVWVHKLDASGKRVDTATGFILDRDRVVTAFQAIDSAAALDVEFADKRTVKLDAVVGLDRSKDWALLAVPTGSMKPFRRGDLKQPVTVGHRYIVFNSDNTDVREIGGVDLTGRRVLPNFGERWILSPSPATFSTGGPLLDVYGHVIGVLGGTLTPGARFNRKDMSISPGLWAKLGNPNHAVPLSYVQEGATRTFAQLAAQGVLSAPITPTVNLLMGGTAATVLLKDGGAMPADVSEFSRKDKVAYVYTLWQKREKQGKGLISGVIVDYLNRPRVQIEPKKVSLPSDSPLRVATPFTPSTLEPGYYRADICWNGIPVWRTFFEIRE